MAAPDDEHGNMFILGGSTIQSNELRNCWEILISPEILTLNKILSVKLMDTYFSIHINELFLKCYKNREV